MSIADEKREDHALRDVIDRVAPRIAEEAVNKVLQSLGMDVSDPVEVQKDMAFLTQSRRRCDRFYTEMFENFIGLFWRVVKVVFVVGIIASLGALGLNIQPLLTMFGVGS